MKLRNTIYAMSIALLLSACGGGSSSDANNGDDASGSTAKKIDIKVVSVDAVDSSNGIVSTSEHKYVGGNSLKLKVVLQNVGTESMTSTIDDYKYNLKIVKYDGSSSLISKSYTSSSISTLGVNGTITFIISTNHILKNTDKSYEFTFNDESINNVFKEDDYTNNTKSIDNVYFEDVDLEVEYGLFYRKNSAGANYISTIETIDNNYTYGHEFTIKNNSSFSFYGDFDLIAESTPFTNAGTKITLNQEDLELATGISKKSTADISLSDVTVEKKSYDVTFSIDINDTDNTNNTITNSITIN